MKKSSESARTGISNRSGSRRIAKPDDNDRPAKRKRGGWIQVRKVNDIFLQRQSERIRDGQKILRAESVSDRDGGRHGRRLARPLALRK